MKGKEREKTNMSDRPSGCTTEKKKNVRTHLLSTSIKNYILAIYVVCFIESKDLDFEINCWDIIKR